MITENTTKAILNTSYVVNPTNGTVKVMVSNKNTKKEVKQSVKVAGGFAKNTRYSIYNNGGGYTGL